MTFKPTQLSNAATWTVFVAALSVAVIARLLPHPPNFTPLAAIALFAGAVTIRRWVAVTLVITAMFVSDLALGFHGLMPVVYGCLLTNIWIGHKLSSRLNNSVGYSSAWIAGGSLLGSVLFFLVTNLGCYFVFYPQSMTGLVACFTAAIPFFQYTLAGDLVFSAVLFGSFALSTQSSKSTSVNYARSATACV